MTGDRGLCGGYNNFLIKKTVARAAELKSMGVNVKLVCIGRKGASFFNRRSDQYNIAKTFSLGSTPTTKEAQAIADEIFAEFVSSEVDKVELVYTKFVSLINSVPTIQTLLPMARSGQLCDVEGRCVDFAEDEIFRLTTEGGKMSVERSKINVAPAELDSSLIFEQEPSQILDALLPLYMNSTVLRSLQEALASELAARMNAMNSASDNAAALRKTLTLVYNRQRQAAITSQLIEIVSVRPGPRLAAIGVGGSPPPGSGSCGARKAPCPRCLDGLGAISRFVGGGYLDHGTGSLRIPPRFRVNAGCQRRLNGPGRHTGKAFFPPPPLSPVLGRAPQGHGGKAAVPLPLGGSRWGTKTPSGPGAVGDFERPFLLSPSPSIALPLCRPPFLTTSKASATQLLRQREHQRASG